MLAYGLLDRFDRALGQNLLDRRFLDLDLEDLIRAPIGAEAGDFDADVGLADFADPTDHAARRKDFVALGKRVDHLLVFFLPLHLGADHQKVEHAKHEHNGQKAHDAFCPKGAKRGLGKGGGDKHEQNSGRENRQV